ncbi:MAG: DUF177 domain-containing protein [Magnetococcales bacterium]|nr:DUF177 domain-containing protein [Magnetococcales bacterium]
MKNEAGEKELSALRIPLNAIDRVLPPLTGYLDPVHLEELGQLGEVVAPLRGTFRIVRENDCFRVSGEVSGALILECSRCLRPFREEVFGEFDRLYAVGRDPSILNRETELTEEITYLETGLFSPLRLLEEECILLLPMVPVCKETCPGLCPSCGAELGKGGCRCEQPTRESPFAILKRTLV